MTHHTQPPRKHRSTRVRSLLAALVGVAVLVSTAVTAQANESEVERDGAIDKAVPAISDVVDGGADAQATVKLNCHGYVEEGIGVVGCAWRANTDRSVASWQLWNLQTRPERGSRNLVAELGADVRSYRDPEVMVPAAYVYAVVGLDAEGEIVARSRLSSAVLQERDRELDIMRLDCSAHITEPDLASDPAVESDRAVSIGCEWSATRSEQAVAYELWRSVDGAERHVVARTGLDQTSVRDSEVSVGHRYRYVVLAVDTDGHIVGRSRSATVGVRPHDSAEDRVGDAERDATRELERDAERERTRELDPDPVERPAEPLADQIRERISDVDGDHAHRDRVTDH